MVVSSLTVLGVFVKSHCVIRKRFHSRLPLLLEFSLHRTILFPPSPGLLAAAVPSLYRVGGRVGCLVHSTFGPCLLAVFCVTPVLRTGYAVMVEGFTCLHGCVQYGCCVVVGALSWPWMSVGRLRDTAQVRCDLCVNGGGVLADVCGASDVWCTRL